MHRGVTDEAPSPTRPPRRGLLRRHPVAIAAALAFALLVLALPQLARWGAQRALGGALGVPVAIGALWWNPLSGQATARGVSIGSGAEQITAQRIAAVLDVVGLWRAGDVRVEHLDIDGLVAPLSIDEQYRIRVGAFAGGGVSTTGAVPRIAVHDAALNDARIIVRHPSAGAERDSLLQFNQLNAADIELEPTPSGPRLGMSGRFTGSLDGAPVEGETEI